VGKKEKHKLFSQFFSFSVSSFVGNSIRLLTGRGEKPVSQSRCEEVMVMREENFFGENSRTNGSE